MIRVGIIGMGFMGRMHFGCYQKLSNVKIVALADLNPKRAAGDLSDVWGNLGDAGSSQLPMDGIRSFTDYRELLAMDLDIVDICVPTPIHPEIAIAALKSGKSVLCEKPLALSEAIGRSVLDAASSGPGHFMPAMCIRFWPEWAWLKKVVSEKTYGELLSVSLTRLASLPPTPWYARGEESGGAILDVHVHDTDFICWLLGVPKSVCSQGYSKVSGNIDHVITEYKYDGVRMVTAEGGWCMQDGFGFRMRYLANFENATVDYDLARSDVLVVHQNGKSMPVTCDKSDGWTEEIRYFVNCVESGRKPAVVTAGDAVSALRVIAAERRSIATGAPAVV